MKANLLRRLFILVACLGLTSGVVANTHRLGVITGGEFSDNRTFSRADRLDETDETYMEVLDALGSSINEDLLEEILDEVDVYAYYYSFTAGINGSVSVGSHTGLSGIPSRLKHVSKSDLGNPLKLIKILKEVYDIIDSGDLYFCMVPNDEDVVACDVDDTMQIRCGEEYDIVVFSLKSRCEGKSFSFTLEFQGATREIAFDANGGVLSGGASCIVKEGADAGSVVPVPAYGGYPFEGWYTDPVGGTRVYDANGHCVSGEYWTDDNKWKYASDITLYAHWRMSGYSIRFNKNDGTGDNRTLGFTQGVSTPLPSCTGDLGWTRPGYAFAGWATSAAKAAAGVVWKEDGDSVSAAIASGKTLDVYAVWTNEYSIRFIRNEGSGFVSSQKFVHGVKTRLPSLKSLGWARRGFTFKGWATSTANARAGKVWKGDWAYVTSATAAGTELTVYAVWELSSGSYAIRFNKNDGSGRWRELGYEYGKNTTLPTIANGLGWTRSGYRFVGWATSAKKAAAGTVWRGDAGVTRTPVAAGKTLSLYAIWRKTGASVSEAVITDETSGVSVAATRAPEGDVLLPGYYSGLLADGTGTYDLLVDEGGETGYVRIVTEDGVFEAEVSVDLVGGEILVTDEVGGTYILSM